MTNSSRVTMGALAIAGVLAASAAAKADHHETAPAVDHSQHTTGNTAEAPKKELTEASKAYEAAMEKMHKGMMVPLTNDVDVDFVRGMIPHHQGAIDQAQILLKYSKNPRLRRLAGGIIAAQRREIRFMEKWLKEHDQGVKTEEMPDWLKAAPDGDPGPDTQPEKN